MLAFVGGQVDKSPAGDPLHAYDLATQTAVVIRHIDTVLQECGAGLADVVKLVAFYATAGDVDEAAWVADIGGHILSSFYREPAGTSTGVPLPFLPLKDLMVSVETVAITQD